MRSEPPPSCRWIFWAIFSLLLLDRLDLLWRFGFPFTDNDQVVIWMGTRDYSRGVFHEPCFYGQNYNYMLEAFLAAPFFRLGIPCWYLLPLVTSALALAPYLAVGFCFLRRDLLVACVFVAIPLLLPAQFGMLTTMPRGFVTGLCFVALFPLIDRLANWRVRFLGAGVAGGLAFVMNPNAAPAVAALVLLMMLRGPRLEEGWVYPLLGALPFLGLNYLVSLYYAGRPTIHELRENMMVFQPSLLLDGLQHLDRHFAWLCPVFWPHGSVVLLLLLALAAVLAVRGRWPEAGALLAATAMMVAALGFQKIHDGAESAGYAYSRMFLAAPLLLGIGFSFCAGLVDRQKPALVVLLLACAGVVSVKAATLDATVLKETAVPPPPIALRRVEEVRRKCALIHDLCRGDIELVVALPPPYCLHEDAYFYCVGGEMMFPDHPRTLIYGYDRRVWRSEAEMATVSSNILFIGGGRRGWQQLAQRDSGISAVGDGELVLHRVHNKDGLPLRELLRKIKPVMQSN